MADSTPILTGGLTGLPRAFADQFAQQMQEDRADTKAALGERKGALQQYQEAIQAAPKKVTAADQFGGIGEGYFASPEWSWNPHAALAQGFQRANAISDLRRNQGQAAPIESAKVGYEDSKDVSDKYLTKSLSSPSGILGYEGRVLSQQGLQQRQLIGVYSGVFGKAYTEALKTAKGPAAIELAVAATNEAAARMGLPKPDPEMVKLLTGGVMPGGGAVPPPPGPLMGGTAPSPMDQLPPNVRAAIEEEQRANPSKPGAPTSLNIRPGTIGYQAIPAPIQGQIPGTPPPKPPLGAPPPVAAAPALPPGANPGETVPQRAARLRTEEEGRALGSAGGKDAVEAGFKYRTAVGTAAENAIESNRAVNEIANDLEKLGPIAGKLGGPRKFIATWKVALGIGNEEDVKDAAAAENADKVSYQLAVNTVKQISSRPAQMEFMGALQNNPNLSMTPEGWKAMIKYLKQKNDDAIDQMRHFNDWQKNNTSEKNPEKWAEHQIEYQNHKAKIIEGRAIGTSGKPVQVQFNGQSVDVTPEWDSERGILKAKYPDGRYRKLEMK